MVILAVVFAALALGFMLGRIWEIRKNLSQQSKPLGHSDVQASNGAAPRDLLSDVPMGFDEPLATPPALDQQIALPLTPPSSAAA